jgi:hypothetical protein
MEEEVRKQDVKGTRDKQGRTWQEEKMNGGGEGRREAGRKRSKQTGRKGVTVGKECRTRSELRW